MIEPGEISPNSVLTARPSRRAVISALGVMLVTPPGLRLQTPSPPQGMLQVRVAPPIVTPISTCVREVSVAVTVAGSPVESRFHAYGDVWEADEPDGDPDFCCGLIEQPILIAANRPLQFLLTGKALAAEIGVVKGLGPALDETDSADLVELFARIWLRDQASGEEIGPWQSPLRSAVASTARDWAPYPQFPGSILAPLRGAPAPACPPFGKQEPGVSLVRP